MPLEQGNSKEAFHHNVKAEIKAGKPLKQALAISYSTRRKNDVSASPAYQNKMAMYDVRGNLKNPDGSHANSPAQAKQIATQESGQSNQSQRARNFSMYDKKGKMR